MWTTEASSESVVLRLKARVVEGLSSGTQVFLTNLESVYAIKGSTA